MRENTVIVALIVTWLCIVANFWLTFNNSHQITVLQDQLTDSVAFTKNLEITIQYIYPNDTDTISKNK